MDKDYLTETKNYLEDIIIEIEEIISNNSCDFLEFSEEVNEKMNESFDVDLIYKVSKTEKIRAYEWDEILIKFTRKYQQGDLLLSRLELFNPNGIYLFEGNVYQNKREILDIITKFCTHGY